ncbi:MAG: M3 family oligoendopeptidase [Armatimonadota bacterium]|nr:M3 family oligoendopeptidase [Armatimonadota bacterium]MDR7465853.1 M3 family oligoendopeptidase [Armatimonadota bacterium]MDR7493761.1 M3 family oligoendopeptidase [Armatimonadota bacterium]MDR7498367.1 M3 family oligoendopeptidase [Armatimonadota bacterium]MDR7503295.1 M3 family oligoendopeptidase [Armatimonadota bacterium]
MMQVEPRREFPRRFVPKDADMGNWTHLEPLFRQLLARKLDTVSDLEQWLLDCSELSGAVLEERTRRYIAMTTQTDDPVREAAYNEFLQEIDPKVKPLWHALNVAYLQSPARSQLPASRYGVLDRHVENDVALFRQENVPLETEEALLAKDYQKVMGAMTVTYRGQELTLQQAGKYLEETDRAVRQEVWELVARRRLQDRDTIEDIYDRLLDLRQRMARNAGFANYRDYAFKRRRRFDYTPEDCFAFHRGVEEAMLPLVQRIYEDRRRKLGIPTVRPWDTQVDPLGRPPLRPFATAEDLVRGCAEIFRRIDPALGRQFEFLAEAHLLDLESRKGKAPGGYQSTLHERRWPFIFMNAVGRDDDLRTLLHEAGHAFHQLAAREEPLIHYRHAPLEFAEVASMGMELLAAPHLDVFYRDEAEYRRAYRNTLEDAVLIFPWIATIDAFQHWIYTHQGHGREERRDRWLELYRRFQPSLDWSGYEEELAFYWHRQLHLFTSPFYYIEYGIAEIGALQVWLQSRTDHRAAVERYWQALSLGGSRPLPELFAAAGATFKFDAETLAPLAEAVAMELDRIGD